jgi:hypothetical protein
LTILINTATERAPLFDARRLPNFIKQNFTDGNALLLIDGFDEADPQTQGYVVEWFRALGETYPTARLVTTGAADQLNGLIGLGFHPLALMTWGRAAQPRFIQQWGEIWSWTVAQHSQADPNSGSPTAQQWLGIEQHGSDSLRTDSQSLGRVRRRQSGRARPRLHRRPRPPRGSRRDPVAALELLAMQVVLTSQPIFDPRKARAWVKQYDIVDDRSLENADTETSEEDGSGLPDRIAKDQDQEIKSPAAVPSFGLLSKLVESGLLISHTNEQDALPASPVQRISRRSGNR